MLDIRDCGWYCGFYTEIQIFNPGYDLDPVELLDFRSWYISSAPIFLPVPFFAFGIVLSWMSHSCSLSSAFVCQSAVSVGWLRLQVVIIADFLLLKISLTGVRAASRHVSCFRRSYQERKWRKRSSAKANRSSLVHSVFTLGHVNKKC